MSPGDKLRFARLWWTVGWGLTLFIIWASLVPHPPKVPLVSWDKAQHFSAYGLLGFWFTGITQQRRYLWVAGGLILLGALMELGQGFMGLGREMEFGDFVANTAGVATSVALAYAGLGAWMVWVERRLGVTQ